MKNNIALIGMPGAGKSTLGVILAKATAYKFIDTDLLIQEQSGRRLQDIIDSCGNEAFLALENRIVSGIETQRTVIATGGSVIYGKEAMENLHRISTVVYLSVGYEEIERRVADFRARGIAMGGHATLRELYDERVGLYSAAADITVPFENCSAEKTVAGIAERLRKEFNMDI